MKTDDCGVGYYENSLCCCEGNIYLGQYKVAEGTKIIKPNAFYKYGNTSNWHPINVGRVIFPSSLIAIGSSSFCCNSIRDCVIPESIQFIGRKAFYGCRNLCAGQLSLPKELRYLEAEAFAECVSITSVVFHDKIKEIGSHAFRGCSALKTAYIPDSVEKIGSGVFDDCPNLESICISKGTREKFEKLFPFDKDKLVECETVSCNLS